MAPKSVSVAKKPRIARVTVPPLSFAHSSTTCGSERLMLALNRKFCSRVVSVFGLSPFGDASRSFHFVFIGELATDESFPFCVKHLLLLSNHLLSVNSASYDVRWCIHLFMNSKQFCAQSVCAKQIACEWFRLDVCVSIWLLCRLNCEHLIHASAYDDQFDGDWELRLAVADWLKLMIFTRYTSSSAGCDFDSTKIKYETRMKCEGSVKWNCSVV